MNGCRGEGTAAEVSPVPRRLKQTPGPWGEKQERATPTTSAASPSPQSGRGGAGRGGEGAGLGAGPGLWGPGRVGSGLAEGGGRGSCCADARGPAAPRLLEFASSAMPSYTVTVATGSQWFAGTDDYIYLSLVGSAGCSEKHLLDKPFYNDFERGAVGARGWDRPGWGHPRPRRGGTERAGGAPGPAGVVRDRAKGVSGTTSGRLGPKFRGGRLAG